jgi:RNA polymerase sigma factor (sigma-70 family)
MGTVANGGLDAATILFRRYQKPLFNFFLRLGFERQSSEDMVQSVFERVLKYRQTYREEMPFRAWLYQIARNVKADAHAKQKHWDTEPLDTVRLDVLEQYSIEQQMAETETLAHLERSMAKLPGDQLEILLLTRHQKLKYAEVAHLLGCSEGTVKVKVFRALQQLRTLFFTLEKQ